MELKIVREPNEICTPGKFYINDVFFAYCLEDKERLVKVAAKTAIPRGRYAVTLTMSNRFKRIMPLVLNVPNFEGVRIHGGNTDADTHGCPLIGKRRDLNKIWECAEVNEKLITKMQKAMADKEKIFLTIV